MSTLLVRAWQETDGTLKPSLTETCVMKGVLSKKKNIGKVMGVKKNDDAPESLCRPQARKDKIGSSDLFWLNPTASHWASDLAGAILRYSSWGQGVGYKRK